MSLSSVGKPSAGGEKEEKTKVKHIQQKHVPLTANICGEQLSGLFLPFENSRHQEVWLQQTDYLSTNMHVHVRLQQLIVNFKYKSDSADVTHPFDGYVTHYCNHTAYYREIIGATGLRSSPEIF